MTTAYDRNTMGNIPYYNDFDEDKKFLQIMFKPGFPVQARELSQVQSILQNQVERFGNHIFKNGSVVLGGAVNESNAGFVRISTDSELTETTLSNMVGQIVQGTNGDVTTDARVVAVSDKPLVGASLDNDPYQVLFLQYLTPGSFTENQRISTVGSGNIGVAVTTLSDATPSGAGSVSNFISVNDGVYYTDGYFAKVDRQSFAAYDISSDGFRDYSDPTKSVGFKKTKSIVSVENDSSLRDPSFGFSNFNAPGADRFKVELTLDQRGLTGSEIDGFTITDKTDYFELVRIIDGTTTRKIKYPEYAELEKTLARRTFDESGHYTVRPFELEVDTYEDTFGIVDTSKFGVKLSPGKAYVKGFEFETIATTKLEDTFPNTTTQEFETANTAFGAYIDLVDESDDGGSGNRVGDKIKRLLDLRNNNASNEPFLQGRQFFAYALQGTDYVKVGSFNVQNLFTNTNNDGGARIYISNLRSVPNGAFGLSNTVLISTGDIDSPGVNPTDTSFNSADLTPGVDRIIPGTQKLLFKVGEGVQKLNNPVSFPMVRPFRAIADVNGKVTISATDSNRKFVGSRGAVSGSIITPTYILGTNAQSKTIRRSDDFSINDSNGTMTLTIRDAAGRAVSNGTAVLIFAPLEGVSTKVAKTKVLSGDITTTYSNITANGVVDLGVVDVTSVSSVINTDTGQDIVNDFILDDGQRVDAYDFSSLRIKPDTAIPAVGTQLTVTYKRFTRTGSDGPFTADSYSSVAAADVPKFNGFRLTNFVDYRPDRQSSTLNNLNDSYSYALSSSGECDPVTPPPDDVEVTTVRFGARIDSVVLTQEREFLILKGVPSAIDPKPPAVSPNDMELYRLIIPADAQDEEDIRVVYIDNQRFTMRDIGVIEQTQQDDSDINYRRSLVSQAVARANSTENAIPISLSGVFVDEFAGHGNADVSRTNYNVSIDPIRNRMYPPFISSSVGVSGPDSSLGTVMPSEFDRVIMTAYTPNTFASETGSSNTKETINPYGSVDYYGTLKLSPFCINYWSSTRKPRVFANSDGQLNNWELDITVRSEGNISGRDKGFGTTWRDWELHWFGTRFEALENTSFISPLDKEYRGNELRTAFITRSLSKRLVRRVQDRILDFSIKPFIPTTTFTMKAEGLRPQSDVYVYIDEDLLDGPFTVGLTGAIQQDVTIPGDTFTVGEKRITVLDDADGDVTKSTTSADAFFYAERLLDTSINNVSFSRPPSVRRESSNSNFVKFESYSDLFDSTRNTVINSLNPIQQIFTVNPDNFQNGIFLTDVDLFFTEVTEDGTPVTVSIRPLVNGVPSKSIVIPFSEVTAQTKTAVYDDVNRDLSNPTKFTFSTPVYLPPGDYSLAVQTNDLSVGIYTNETDVEQAEFGSLYLPENNGNNVAYNDRRLCAVINRAVFGIDSGGNTVTEARTSLTLLDTDFISDVVYASNAAENNSLFANTLTLTGGGTDRIIRQNSTTEIGRRNIQNGSLIFDLNFTGNYSTVVDVDQVSLLSSRIFMNTVSEIGGSSNEVTDELAIGSEGSDLGSPSIAKYYSKIIDLEAAEPADNLAIYIDGNFTADNQVLAFAKFRGANSANIQNERYYQLYVDGDTQLFTGTGIQSNLFELWDNESPAPSNGGIPSDLNFSQYLFKIVWNGDISEGESIPFIDGVAALPLREQVGLNSLGSGIPTGTILPYGPASADPETGSIVPPSGFLFCDGSTITATSHPALYNVIGETYNTGGEGDGKRRLPDLQGRTLIGVGGGVGLTTRTLGQTGGTELVAPHEHDMLSPEAISDGYKLWGDTSLIQEAGSAGNSSYSFNNNSNNGSATEEGTWNTVRARSTDTGMRDGGLQVFSDTAVRLDPNATEQMPPFVAVNYIIRT